MIFCDPAVTITTNLLLIFVCVAHQLKINIMHVFYMNILYVIGCKNTHTVLLKLYNQFYMNILHEIVCKNVHTFMKRIYVFYWLTPVEINKHKIFDANNA